MSTIIAFILIFTVVVVSHEFGHYILAKKNGIKVVEFSIGMGPALFKYTKGDTQYALRILPIGGACLFEGEDGLNKGDDSKESSTGSFQSASVLARMSTVFAGPFFNLILGFLLSLIVVWFSGSDKPVVTGISEGLPAQEAGLEVGDEIISIDGERVHLYREITLISYLNSGETIEIEYKRDDEKNTIMVTPFYDEEADRYFIGILGGGEYVDCKSLNVFQYSYYEVRYWLKYTVKSLFMLVQGKVSSDDVSGPVGMVQVIDQTIEVATPYGLPTVLLTLMNFAILLSVNLAVLNLLPIPALDGGRLLFLFIEIIRGKPIPPEKEGIVHFIGFAALMILMVVVLFNDISKLFV